MAAFPAAVPDPGLARGEELPPQPVLGLQEIALAPAQAQQGGEEVPDGERGEGKGADPVELGEEAPRGPPFGAEAEGRNVDPGAVVEEEGGHGDREGQEAVMAWGWSVTQSKESSQVKGRGVVPSLRRPRL